MKKNILSFSLLFTLFTQGTAQETHSQGGFFKNQANYQVRANFSLGGAAPLGLPREIRKIESYNPTLATGLQVNMTKWLTEQEKIGIRLGLGVDAKGMKTKARVKSYLTAIQHDHQIVKGYYTGRVETRAKNTYVTIPVSVVYKISPEWNFYGGFFTAATVHKIFEGNVSEGYLRQGTPTGPKITFEGDAVANYDFSSEIRNFQWGIQLGAEWISRKNFLLFPEISYGINGIFKPGFDSISFSMHNINLNLGFGYQF